jgi:hypothetical protein
LAINYLIPHPFLAARWIAAELNRKASSEDIETHVLAAETP